MPDTPQHSSLPNQEFMWQIACKVPNHAVEPFEEYLRQHCEAVSAIAGADGNLWRIEGLTDTEPDRETLQDGVKSLAQDMGLTSPTLEYAIHTNMNWVVENLTSFSPIRHGCYFIHGSHYKGKVPSGTIPLMLNAGTAFGSGDHPSTGGCLQAIGHLAKRQRYTRILDVGCGSGILAIAMAKTWHTPVLAADIDPEAVTVTKANAKQNQTSHLVRSTISNGYNHRIIRSGAPYNLVTANILAHPLSKLARDLARITILGSVAVLSGFLERDIAWMIRIHQMVGFQLIAHRAINGWSTLIIRKRG